MVNVQEGINENGDNALTGSEVEFTNDPEAQTGIPEDDNYTVTTKMGNESETIVETFKNGKKSKH